MLSWDDDLSAVPGTPLGLPQDTSSQAVRVRLDSLLPQQAATGAVTMEAFRVYLDTMIDMVSRAAQPLSVFALAVNDSPLIRFFGAEGAGLIGRAIVRCVHQETRPHDVVGLSGIADVAGIPVFVVACPLLNEEQTAKLATRLRYAMTAEGLEGSWLTLSIGVTSLSLDITDAGALLARADSALQRAQRQGGGVWRHTDTLRRIIEQQDEAQSGTPPADND